jgi:phosphatidate cytidylyltransferase
MAPEGQDRGDGFDDLFEELDHFFSPGGQAERKRQQKGGEHTDPEQRPQEGGGAEDLLPPGWKPDIEGLDLAATEEPEAPRRKDRKRRGRSERTEEPPPRAEEPTGEMTSEDWTRLRDVLGEEPAEDEEANAVPSEGPRVTAEENPFGDDEPVPPEDIPEWLEPGAGKELTLEDLKKAPPEYSELPKPDEEPRETRAGRRRRRKAEEREARGARDAIAPEAPQAAEPEAPAPEAKEAGIAEAGAAAAGSEPTMAEVEAAADHLAEDFRDAPDPRAVEEELLADLEEPTGPRTVRVGAAETMTGPTWEEPTSRPLTAEPAAPPSLVRDLPAALITAAVLAVVALISLWVAKSAFVVIAGGVVLLGQAELYATMSRKGYQPATALGLAVGGLSMAGAYLRGESAMMFFVALGLFLSFLWYMAAPLKSRENLVGNVGATILGVLYGPFLAGYVFMLLAQRNSGRALMLLIITLAFLYDIAAYAFGSAWGSRPLAPTVSPRKSWEGVLGGTVVALAVAAAAVPNILKYFSTTQAIGLAIVVVVFAPLGDLIESLIKRDLGVKDMGSVLPGHGGVLDRIDSVLLVAPAVFYYLRLIF